MKGLSKNLLTALLAVSAAVCLIFGLLFAIPQNASADEVTPGVTLSATENSEYLKIENGVFLGLTDKSETETVAKLLNGQTFAIELPASVTSIGEGLVVDNVHRSILGTYSARLLSITIPSGVKSIGNYAFFQCTSLKSIIIPANVVTIGEYAFDGCTQLSSLSFNSINGSLTTIGAYAFRNTAITNITIPANVTTIGTSAFSGCSSVTTINYYAKAVKANTTSPFVGIGKATVYISGQDDAKITQIPTSLFRGTNITTVNFSNVDDIPRGTGFGQSAFESCTSLTTVNFTNCRIDTIREMAFKDCTSLSEINLNSVSELRTIGAQAFQGCSSLLTVTIPSSVTEIGDSAFNGCTGLLEVQNLSNINIVKGDKANNGGIGANAKNIYNASGKSQIVANGDYKFFYYKETADSDTAVLLVSYTGTRTELTLPASVTLDGATYNSYKINDSAFRNKSSITGVKLNSGVSSIGERAFEGCTSLKEIDIPRTVDEVGKYAFYRCTALERASIEDSLSGLSIISASVFEGCTSLKEIIIPQSITSINTSAFKGCSKLEKVTFKAGSNNKYRITKMETSAFEGCVALTEIAIPDSVTVIGGEAFKGCVSLEKAYLPEKLNSAGKDVFFNCAANLILIAHDSNSYQEYLKVENFAGYSITYKIELELHPKASAEKVSVDAYFGVRTKLPVQEGYASSVWYSDEGAHNDIVDEDELYGMLCNPATSKITLYANDTKKPEGVTAKTNLTYTESGWLTTSYSTLYNGWENNYSALYTVEVTRYLNVAGDEVAVTDKTRIKDAGTYYLSILIKDEQSLGQWKEGVPLTLKVTPAQVTDLSAFEWGVVSGNTTANLDPVNGTDKVYIYDNKPYIEKQYDAGNNELTHDDDYEHEVTKSWLSLLGSTYTVVLKGDKAYGGNSQYIKSAVYQENSARSWGIYTASVTVILDNNYRLPTSNIENGLLKNQGITIDYGTTPNEFIISKVWYIIASDSNKLLSEDGKSSYTISDWTYSYKGDTVISAPVLLEGDAKELVKYSLAMYENEGAAASVIFDEFGHESFGLYVNAAMPAGYYVLTVSIKDCVVDGKTITGTGISLGKDEDRPYTFSFTVGKASWSTLLKKDDGSGYLEEYFDSDFATKTKTLYAEYKDGVKTFGDTKSVVHVLTLKPEQLHPTDLRARTAWVDEKFDKYYTAFEISYRIVGDGGIYGTLDEYTNAPTEIGKYSINYNVYAPSYDDSFNDSSASRSYTLFIQGIIGAPVIDVEYTGKSWADKINFNSRYFDVVYLNDGNQKSINIRNELGYEKDEYINAGTHRVVLMLNDTYQSLAKWNSSDLKLTIKESTSYGTYAVFTFSIDKASNATTQKPQLRPWEWGNYDENTNVPQWSTQFVTEYNYMLVSKDGSKTYWYEPLGDEQLGFDKADAGDYWLKPIAAGNANVKEFNTHVLNNSNEWLEVTILKATVTWAETSTPRIDSWKYGDDSNYTEPEGTLSKAFSDLQGTWTNYFCLYSDYLRILNGERVTTYSNLAALQDSNEEHYVPAGSYVYVYELSAKENANYNAWSYPVYFSVLKADNYWDKTPVIHDRSYGDENELTGIEYLPHFGDAKNVNFEFWYIDENGVASPLGSSVKGSELEIGKYEYKVTLKSSSNYDALVFVDYFYISKAENSWVEIPNVIGWGEGRYKAEKNTPVAEAKFGTVLFTIKDANDNVVIERVSVSELNAEKLNSLKVGTYTIIAEVAGTTNYDELISSTHFAVFEDSVGMTGLIAATVTFAVIAVGLAVAGVILLIRKNKKMEEEFRRMVRSEMRRK